METGCWDEDLSDRKFEMGEFCEILREQYVNKENKTEVKVMVYLLSL